MEIKKTVKEDVLPSFLQATSTQLFIKSPEEDLIMLWRLPISPTTSFLILSHPKQSGMHSNKMTFVLLSRGNALTHRLKCLKFPRYHENWTVEDWKRTLWPDETKINRIGSDGRTYTWKKRGEPLSDRTTTLTVKHGGGNNLMVWVEWSRGAYRGSGDHESRAIYLFIESNLL